MDESRGFVGSPGEVALPQLPQNQTCGPHVRPFGAKGSQELNPGTSATVLREPVAHPGQGGDERSPAAGIAGTSCNGVLWSALPNACTGSPHRASRFASSPGVAQVPRPANDRGCKTWLQRAGHGCAAGKAGSPEWASSCLVRYRCSPLGALGMPQMMQPTDKGLQAPN